MMSEKAAAIAPDPKAKTVASGPFHHVELDCKYVAKEIIAENESEVIKITNKKI